MPALGAGIHASPLRAKAWMAGPSPAMTQKMESAGGAVGARDDPRQHDLLSSIA
jgi:hypothetical protein